MGGHYGSIHIRSTDAEQIAKIITDIAAQRKKKFLVAPPINGWTGIYPSLGGQDESVSAAIARQFSGDILHLIVHDDDLFCYYYYRDNRLADEYSSEPDYFEKVSIEKRSRLRGRPEIFGDLLTDVADNQTTIEDIAEILSVPSEEELEQHGQQYEALLQALLQRIREGYKLDVNEISLIQEEIMKTRTRLTRFAQLFKIVNALSSYEYLLDGEIEEIQAWEEFIHIPDLSEKRNELERIKQAYTELEAEGVLLAALSYPEANDLKDPPVLLYSPDKKGGFLVGWLFINSNEPFKFQLKRYSELGESATNSVELPGENKPSIVQVSPSGKLLAVGNAYGLWKTTLYNLEEKSLLLTIPHICAVSGIQFTPDERVLISRSETEIILTSIRSLQQVAAIETGVGFTIACHPNGRFLLADEECRSRLAVIDMETHSKLKVLSTAARDYNDWMLQVQQGEGVTQFDRHETLINLAFSPDGKLLFCAMHQGVRVFEWKSVLSATDELPPPIATASSEVVTVDEELDSRMASTYDLTLDWQRNLLLFGGLEGKIRFLDVATDRSGTLLELPGKPAILKLDLSSDLASLCTHSLMGMFDRQRQPAVFQIWNYQQLIERQHYC